MMHFTFLGTGTSQGISVRRCSCNVCTSSGPRDKHLRASAMVSSNKKNIAIDKGLDFRQQMLRAGIDDVEALNMCSNRVRTQQPPFLLGKLAYLKQQGNAYEIC